MNSFKIVKIKNQITQGVDLSFSEVNWESSRNTEIASSKWEILMFREMCVAFKIFT